MKPTGRFIPMALRPCREPPVSYAAIRPIRSFNPCPCILPGTGMCAALLVLPVKPDPPALPALPVKPVRPEKPALPVLRVRPAPVVPRVSLVNKGLPVLPAPVVRVIPDRRVQKENQEVLVLPALPVLLAQGDRRVSPGHRALPARPALPVLSARPENQAPPAR